MIAKFRRAKIKFRPFQERLVFTQKEQGYLRTLWASWPPTNGSIIPPTKYITNHSTQEQEQILDCAAILRQYAVRFGLSDVGLC